jgi:glycerol-3-phosphate dehydrogenase
LPWTAQAALPGGDFADRDDQIEETRRRYPFLAEAQARRLTLAYGTRVRDVLGEVQKPEDLGPSFGAELTGVEVRYLMAKEWARSADDILWRRSKLGLSMPAAARDALAQFVISVS